MTQHYQDNLGGWHVLDSVEYEYLLTKNNPGKTFTPKTQSEYDAAHTPQPPTAQEQRDALQAQIDALEQKSLMNRMLREWSISEMEKAAIAFGAAQAPALTDAESLTLAYATNIAYKKVKDLDVQITALRTQMDAIV